MSLRIEPAGADDGAWIARESAEIGGPVVVSDGALHDLRRYPGFVAWRDGGRAGFLIHRSDAEALEILALRALRRREGIGSALLAAAERVAAEAAVPTLTLCTTNDNQEALRFYQRRGFATVLRLKGFDPARVFEGRHGIPIRDVIVLAKTVRWRLRINDDASAPT